jgi:hypothetical protein
MVQKSAYLSHSSTLDPAADENSAANEKNKDFNEGSEYGDPMAMGEYVPASPCNSTTQQMPTPSIRGGNKRKLDDFEAGLLNVMKENTGILRAKMSGRYYLE